MKLTVIIENEELRIGQNADGDLFATRTDTWEPINGYEIHHGPGAMNGRVSSVTWTNRAEPLTLS